MDSVTAVRSGGKNEGVEVPDVAQHRNLPEGRAVRRRR